MISNVNLVVLDTKRANFNGYIVPLLVDLKRAFFWPSKKLSLFFSKNTSVFAVFVIKF